MTTAATVIGHFPLVLATGPGAGARNSIGIMLVTGMIIGTVFTLFVVPSIYMLVARRHVAAESEAAEEVAPALPAPARWQWRDVRPPSSLANRPRSRRCLEEVRRSIVDSPDLLSAESVSADPTAVIDCAASGAEKLGRSVTRLEEP